MKFRELDWIFVVLVLAVFNTTINAQEKQEIFDYANENDFIIGGVSVSGVRYLDINAIIGISGLRVGQNITIPGEAVKNAVQRLWSQGLFSDVRVSVESMKSDTVFLDIMLQERPRISSIKFYGIRQSESQDITEKIKLPVGSQITSYILENTRKIIRDHYIEKGFFNTSVDFVQKDDPDQPNNIILSINIDKKERVKIGDITFIGNESFEDKKLRRQMKGTKQKNLNFFKPSKYIGEKYEEDKEKLLTFYNDNGFKDFTIL
ncbi:MAG: bamA [Bacteroidetes bacterium]|nr:bamA [Bacteroidota bacterium]